MSTTTRAQERRAIVQNDFARGQLSESELAERMREVGQWERARLTHSAAFEKINEAEQPIAERLKAIRDREKERQDFRIEQLIANQWITFDRAALSMTSQKGITAKEAKTLLLDAICAGKIADKSIRCLHETSANDEFWTAGDFKALLEVGSGQSIVLADTYIARSALLGWMLAIGFQPTTDILGVPAGLPHRILPTERPKRPAETQVYDLLKRKYPDYIVPFFKFEDIRKHAGELLKALPVTPGAPKHTTVGIDTIYRVFQHKP